MVADEEAAIAAVIAAIFLVNKEEEENRETVLDLPNVLAVLYTKERRHTLKSDNIEYLKQKVVVQAIILNGQDCLIVLPTGYGKSLTYQMLPLL